MFSLFKKSESVVAGQRATNYPTVVNEIHNEFMCAGEKILQEANAILQEAQTKSIEKGKRLAAIGFSNTPEAMQAIDTEMKIIMTKEIAGLVEYYSINYPNNKFITEEMVKSICEKYGLVCGEVSAYKGFVPENKLSLIENFKIKNDNDFIGGVLTGSNVGYNKYDVYLGVVAKKEITGFWRESICQKNGSATFTPNNDTSEHFSKRINSYFNQFTHLTVSGQNSTTLKICAPLKDMEVGDRQMVVGYKIQDIPDPVVLRPVMGGYLIVCAWGNESSDEIVVNQKMN